MPPKFAPASSELTQFYRDRRDWRSTGEERMRFKKATRLGKVRAGAAVLDIGARDGGLKRYLPPDTRYQGIDITPEFQAPDILIRDISTGIPFPDGAFDYVFCIEVLEHVPNPYQTLGEIHRVLRPGGGFALLWNWPDDTGRDWARSLWSLLEEHRRGAPSFLSMEWRKAVEGVTGFTHLQEEIVSWTPRSTMDSLLARISSISFIAALPDEKRAGVLQEARDLLRTHPDTRDKEEIASPYKTHVFWCFKSAAAA